MCTPDQESNISRRLEIALLTLCLTAPLAVSATSYAAASIYILVLHHLAKSSASSPFPASMSLANLKPWRLATLMRARTGEIAALGCGEGHLHVPACRAA